MTTTVDDETTKSWGEVPFHLKLETIRRKVGRETVVEQKMF